MSNSATDRTRADLLIVDDKPANLRLLAAMLAEQGYKVRSAINGPLALTATREIQDAILTEVHAFTGDAPQHDDLTLLVVVRE